MPLRAVLRSLPWDLPAGVLVLQHIAGVSQLPLIVTPGTRLPVKFAECGEPVQCGRVHIGPPGRHLVVTPDGCLTLSDAPRVRCARPSADWLFESTAAVFAERAIGVVLSGRLADGARGALRIARAGGHVIAQEPSTCRYPDMPIAVIETGAVDLVLPPDRIGSAIVAALGVRDILADGRRWSDPFVMTEADSM